MPDSDNESIYNQGWLAITEKMLFLQFSQLARGKSVTFARQSRNMAHSSFLAVRPCKPYIPQDETI